MNYLFTRKMFNWNEAKYTQVTTGVMGMTVIGSLFVLPVLSYHLGFPDFVIGLLAATSMMAKTVSVAFSTTGTQYVIGRSDGAGERDHANLYSQPTVLVSSVLRPPPSSGLSSLKLSRRVS